MKWKRFKSWLEWKMIQYESEIAIMSMIIFASCLAVLLHGLK